MPQDRPWEGWTRRLRSLEDMLVFCVFKLLTRATISCLCRSPTLVPPLRTAVDSNRCPARAINLRKFGCLRTNALALHRKQSSKWSWSHNTCLGSQALSMVIPENAGVCRNLERSHLVPVAPHLPPAVPASPASDCDKIKDSSWNRSRKKASLWPDANPEDWAWVNQIRLG